MNKPNSILPRYEPLSDVLVKALNTLRSAKRLRLKSEENESSQDKIHHWIVRVYGAPVSVCARSQTSLCARRDRCVLGGTHFISEWVSKAARTQDLPWTLLQGCPCMNGHKWSSPYLQTNLSSGLRCLSTQGALERASRIQFSANCNRNYCISQL